MKPHQRYVFHCYGSPTKTSVDDIPKPYVLQGIEAMLEEVVKLTKEKMLFAVHEVGECIGDFS